MYRSINSIAIMLTALPRQISYRIADLVLMPALSESRRHGNEKLRSIFIRTRRVILPVGMLSVLGGIAVAPAFFTFLYDDRYQSAGLIAQLSMLPLWFSFLAHRGIKRGFRYRAT